MLLERGQFSESNWSKLLEKLNKTLALHFGRGLTNRGRAIIANVMACSRLWYVASVCVMPKDFHSKFNFALIKFLWAHKTELVNRTIMCGSLDSGGVGSVNIEHKLNALLLIHVCNIILGTKAKWFYFVHYVFGFFLRHLNADLYSRSRPHITCDLPLFYLSLHKILF